METLTTDDKEKTHVAWCQFSDKTHERIEKLLDFASANYSRHTEWFLKHRDRALTELGALIAAEVAFAKLVEAKFSPPFLVVLYVVFVLLAVGFGLAGTIGCRQAYRAAMESIAVANKAIWALGLSGRVEVKGDQKMRTQAPVLPGDTSIVAHRWVTMSGASTTDQLVEHTIGNGWGVLRPRKNTCFLATFSIGILAAGGVVIGSVLALKAVGIVP